MMTDDKYGTREVQTKLLQMMKDIHGFCMKEKISYSLCSGSVLGAVRHGGFIPWDDDMDIMMDRFNFEKFKSCCERLQGYKVCCDSLWVYRITRVLNEDEKQIPTIDIFVLDNCPDSEWQRRLKLFAIKTLQGMLKEKYSISNYSLFHRICLGITKGIGKLFKHSTKYRWYDSISQIGNDKKTQYISCYNDLFKLISIRYKSSLMNELQLHSFEDSEFYIPCSYDIYLTQMYGNYMEFPPEEERVPSHI